MIVIGVDTGGTFTDFIYKKGDAWSVYKRLSTPANPARAVLEGLRQIGGKDPRQIVHGSTVATNALLERKGVKTVLITNRGFEDIIEIGRQNRTRLYDPAYRKEPPIVPASLRFGVRGRILCTGEILEDLNADDVQDVLEKIRKEGAESIAVCLLFSFVNPAHEKEVERLLRERDAVPVSLSHEVLSEFREYERTSTTLINAYVSPIMKHYISCLSDSLGRGDNLRIMQSNGGCISAQKAMSESVRTILSGPAGGVVGAFEIGKMAGFEKLIAFDMGGTSTDVSLLDGKLPFTLESTVAGYPVKVPMIDIHTVGAGGGSIASINAGGALKVGPESAGADPGPVCHGKGRRITVTDANLYLGRLVPETFLGGQMRLRVERLEAHFRKMSEELQLSPVELAEGILSVANATMERAIRVISVERGHDPREFTLLSFGGAGGLHAAFLAKLLDIPRVLVPQNPGILSAIGMLLADVVKDYSLTVMLKETDMDKGRLLEMFRPLETRGTADLASEGIGIEHVVLDKYLDMRYQGQSYEIIVPVGDDSHEDYVESFHRAHENMYGYRNTGKIVEIVNIRLRGRGFPEKPAFKKIESGTPIPPDDAFMSERDVIFDSIPLKAKVLDRSRLMGGNTLRGPAIVTEYSSTIIIPPFAEVIVDAYGNLIIDVK